MIYNLNKEVYIDEKMITQNVCYNTISTAQTLYTFHPPNPNYAEKFV